MTKQKFYFTLKKEGFSPLEIAELEKRGREAAHDAHDDLYCDGYFGDMSREDFDFYCRYVGRDFVVENLEEFK